MPRYRVEVPGFFNEKLVEPGEIIELDGPPYNRSPGLTLLDEQPLPLPEDELTKPVTLQHEYIMKSINTLAETVNAFVEREIRRSSANDLV